MNKSAENSTTCWEKLAKRGLVADISDQEAIKSLCPGDAFYIGFDPTAPYLQIGNLVPLIVTMHLAKAGLRPIILFGGATGAIGDPSGKNEERKLLPREVIKQNIERQSSKVREIFKRQGISVEVVDNLDWTDPVTLIDFLRDTGKHFPVNYMLAKEVVKTRLSGEGMSYAEFSYMLLQAFDFLHLFQTKNCKLQIGGSDQWGNMTSGIELVRRKLQKEVFALSIPLLTNSDGRKFGKSEEGAIWLAAEGTSPFKLHQFWLNTEDKDAARYLRIFSFLNESEIAALEAQLASAPEKREVQKRLADEVCTLVHGKDATDDAKRSAQVLFGGDISGLSEAQLEEIFSDVPSKEVPKAEVAGMNVVDLFVSTGLSQSKGEARRLMSAGGAYVNNKRIDDPATPVHSFLPENARIVILRSGKKSYFLLKLA